MEKEEGQVLLAFAVPKHNVHLVVPVSVVSGVRKIALQGVVIGHTLDGQK